MSREFKFWDSANKNWFNEDNVVMDWNGRLVHKYLHCDMPLIPIEYIGQNDSNDHKIYEGSILRLSYLNPQFRNTEIEVYIKWNVWNWSMFTKDDKYYTNCSPSTLNSREPVVINHILNNPTWLTKIKKTKP